MWYWIKRNILGIYESFNCEVLNKPIQNGYEWSYDCKIISTNKYFFRIKYKVIPYGK